MAFVAISLKSAVPDPVHSVIWLAVRHTPSLREILKWPQVGAEKPAEKEMKEDHLMNA